jgi:CheY-like chemotaxis protein
MFSLKAREKHLTFSCAIGPHVPQYIRTDQIRLRQILINLISNAVKFTGTGSVTVRISDYKFRNSEAHQSEFRNLKFEIEDTGPGIAPDEMDTLFDAFSQTQTGQEIQEGTGLGLAISRKFVRLLGGNITVHSEVGQGSTFTFTIPVEGVQEIMAEDSVNVPSFLALKPGSKPYRMLIVDDKADNRNVLVKLLMQLEVVPGSVFEIREATNGEEAVDIWRNWPADMIWLDLRMPVMNGYEAMRAIRHLETANRELEHHAVIIAVTAGAFEHDHSTSQDSGWDAFLHKPFRDRDIISILQHFLDLQSIDRNSEHKTRSVENTKDNTKDPYLRTELLPEAIKSLPEEWIGYVRRAVETIDIDATNALIAQVIPQNPELARALDQLVRQYRFDILQTLFERHE